jgi:hypothetical protein
VPDFYADVGEAGAEETELFEGVGLNMDAYKASLGVKSLTSATAREVLMARWRQPTLTINQVRAARRVVLVVSAPTYLRGMGWDRPRGPYGRACCRCAAHDLAPHTKTVHP